MIGSTTFSFSRTKRKAKCPNKEDCEMDPTEVSRSDLRVPNDKFGFLLSRMSGKKVQMENRNPQRACANGTTADKQSQSSLPVSASPKHLRPSRLKTEHSAGSQQSFQAAPRAGNERPLSTMHSYYDPKRSPLAVSQQTSASSARDFMIRKKGVAPILVPPSVGSEPGRDDCVAQPSLKAPQRRPSRLDISRLFPKPSSKSGSPSLPQRHVKAPPSLFVTSNNIKELRLHSFLNDIDTQQCTEQDPPRAQDTHTRQSPITSLRSKKNTRKPPSPMRNWFDNLELDASDDDEAHPGPEMRASFIEHAFWAESSTTASSPALRKELQSEPYISRGSIASLQPPERSRTDISSRSRNYSENGICRPACATDGRVTETPQSSHLACDSFKSRSTAFEYANLQEESIFCSSSDDDEDDPPPRSPQEIIRQGSFLRSSLGLNSSGSEVGCNTTEAIDTSFLRIGGTKSIGLPGSRRASARSAPRLGTVAIPERSSSRQGVSKPERRPVPANLDRGAPRKFSRAPLGESSLAGRPHTERAPKLSRNQSLPVTMTLTPQEATLLEAMRSKKNLMRQGSPMDAHGDWVEQLSASSSRPGQFRYSTHTGMNMAIDDRVSRPGGKSSETMRQSSLNAASREPSLPSGRVSLIFSENLSSPTTGRDSPATPTLDSLSDVQILQGIGDLDGHSRAVQDYCRPAFVNRQSISHPTMLPNHFQSVQHETFEPGDYAWNFPRANGRRDPAMVH